MTPTPATPELLALAHATRPDIDTTDLQGAITAAQTAGWTWPHILVEVARMIAQGGHPRDIRAATTDPLQIHHRPRPTT